MQPPSLNINQNPQKIDCANKTAPSILFIPNPLSRRQGKNDAFDVNCEALIRKDCANQDI